VLAEALFVGRIGDGIRQHTMKAYELAVRAAISANDAARSAAKSGDPGDCDLADAQDTARGRMDDGDDGGAGRLRAATRVCFALFPKRDASFPPSLFCLPLV